MVKKKKTEEKDKLFFLINFISEIDENIYLKNAFKKYITDNKIKITNQKEAKERLV